MVYKKEEIVLYTKEDLKEIQNDKTTKQKLIVNKEAAAQHKK